MFNRTLSVVAWFAWVAGTVAGALPAAAALRAGAARVEITPPVGTLINGGVEPVVSKVVHDPLYARALVLDDGTTRAGFVLVDTCLAERPTFDEARRLAERGAGVPAWNLMISCTHTHSGGSIADAHLTPPDEAYRAKVPALIAEAVKRAVENLAPAQVAWGSASVPQHVFCRRLFVREGASYTSQLGEPDQRAKMNWDSPHEADGGPTGPVDPELFVVSVRHADGRPLAVLANYSLHYVGGVGPGHVSADYFGAFSNRVAELLEATDQRPEFVAMLTNGTSGDVNNVDPKARRARAAPYEQIDRVADDVAREAVRAIGGMKHRDDVRLRAATVELKLATRRPTAQEVEAARKHLAGRPREKLAGWKDNYARETALMAEYPTEVSVPIQVVRIGELAVAAWPAETFAVTGLELKRRSPVKPLFNVGLANGVFGYIPPPEQHALGAYETWRARTSYLEVDATTKMTEAFLKVLEGLR